MIVSAAKNTSFLFAREFAREATTKGLKEKVAIVTGGVGSYAAMEPERTGEAIPKLAE